MVSYRDVLGRMARAATSLRTVWSKTKTQDSPSRRTDRSRASSDSSSVKLFVGNLPFSADDRELRSLFEKFGPVDSAEIVRERPTGASRGFGFVEMTSKNDAQTAIGAANGKDFMGRAITVNEAHSKPRRSSGANNNHSRSPRSESSRQDGGQRSDNDRRERAPRRDKRSA